ncbi:glycosyltransferase family 2 protein [Algoriphagus zhangzhouensis]|uniref:Glycosyltransferase, GT2 family n=1 Tax=Algoriphagus zhangzhouensis TaxID=1073327 RepID=A0A1M7ZFA4_9BACT|nr:glycosyltransferase [Algoriphagus zhangzhouensis]TDY46222.1 GT2 family glycosyltransferase [Algoriphagus zhangzhouensis]SHO63554.1 Glycosyltransferase, GT2 family [Algoriphagus zhangzhouensis]
MLFSVIIPVYNRPEELAELLSSLVGQTITNFEVVVVEDGSNNPSDTIIGSFQKDLNIQYIFQENTGQGFARNHGMKLAKGDFFVILDSDVILPSDYLEKLENAIHTRKLDAFGGPDAAKDDFSSLQKAMDFAMTSFWTTGGIRGKMKDPSKYQARGFNMGVSNAVFEGLGGFVDPNRGEDIEWSLRIKNAGFKLELVEEAFVYHKRKNTLESFAKQAFSFGQNRVNVSRFHPGAIKLVHLFPSLFLLFLIATVVGFIPDTLTLQRFLLGFWSGMILLTATLRTRSIWVGILSLVCSIVQLSSYGLGLLYELMVKLFKG